MTGAILGVGATMLLAVLASTWHLSGRMTRLETRLDETDKRAPERREAYERQQRETAHAVCAGPHVCAYRHRSGTTQPRIRVGNTLEDMPSPDLGDILP